MQQDSPQAIGPEDMLSLAREMSKAADAMRAIRTQSNNVINAGGITNAVAVCIAASTVIAFILFAGWVMWQVSDAKAQQEAWIQVWQQRISQQKDN